MVRIILCFFALLFSLSAFAGQFEDASRNNKKVFLYIYTPTCGYCKKFDTNYRKLLSAYGNKCKFVKIDGSTQYGSQIAYKYQVQYVPYVVLITTKTKQGQIVPADCLMNYSCVSQKVNSFVNR